MEKNVSLPYYVGSLFKSKENEEDIIKVCSYNVSPDADNNLSVKVGVNKLKEQAYENVNYISLEELLKKYDYTKIVMIGNQKYFDNGISIVDYDETKNKQKL